MGSRSTGRAGAIAGAIGRSARRGSGPRRPGSRSRCTARPGRAGRASREQPLQRPLLPRLDVVVRRVLDRDQARPPRAIAERARRRTVVRRQADQVLGPAIAANGSVVADGPPERRPPARVAVPRIACSRDELPDGEPTPEDLRRAFNRHRYRSVAGLGCIGKVYSSNAIESVRATFTVSSATHRYSPGRSTRPSNS